MWIFIACAKYIITSFQLENMDFENLSSDLGFEAWSKEFDLRFDATVNSRAFGSKFGAQTSHLALGHKFGALTDF